MNTENKKFKKTFVKPRSHRISIYLNDDELIKLQVITEPWNLPRSQVFRRLLFGSHQVMLDTKTSMEALDRIGLALETSNNYIKKLQTTLDQWNPPSEELNSLREKLLLAFESNKSCIKDCSHTILQLIKKL